MVKVLLEESDEDPRRPANYDQTPLHYAASAFQGSAAIIKLLFERNDVEPDARDMGKATPLSIAAKLGNLEAMRLLLDTGKVEIEAFDFQRHTPLSHAAGAGKTAAVMLLLAVGGVDPDSKDWNGRTPLSWAAEFGYANVVKVFLATGKVTTDTPDVEGKTPLYWAAGSSRYISSMGGTNMSRAKREMALEDIRRVLKGQAPFVPSIEHAKREEARKDLPNIIH